MRYTVVVREDESKTDVIFVRGNRSEEPLQRALEDLRHVSSDLRKIGLGLQADRLDEITAELAMPTFKGILADIGSPHTWVTSTHARYLAELITIGAGIVRSLMRDAEITGSEDALKRARVWLQTLRMDGVERET